MLILVELGTDTNVHILYEQSYMFINHISILSYLHIGICTLYLLLLHKQSSHAPLSTPLFAPITNSLFFAPYSSSRLNKLPSASILNVEFSTKYGFSASNSISCTSPQIIIQCNGEPKSASFNSSRVPAIIH